MGKKYIIQEVEESESGCGSIIGIAIIIIAIFVGYKSCDDDNTITPSKINTEQAKQTATKEEIKSPLITPKSKPQEQFTEEFSPKTHPQAKNENTKPSIQISTPQQKDLTEIKDEMDEPALTKKEQRKAERQAKREVRRKEKTQNN